MTHSPIYSSITICLFIMASCKSPSESSFVAPETTPDSSQVIFQPIPLDQTQLYDKVYGMLLGSAIGDAMGAPTEMWSRQNMQIEYGYIDSLTPHLRAPSAEGTWDYNLPAGGTTDDTRWKVLLAQFLAGASPNTRPQMPQLSPQSFAQFIVKQYELSLASLKRTDAYSPQPFEREMRKVNWLQEWALVAKPYADQEWTAYHEALHRFYGGEMVCAGLLFAPVTGAYYPGDPMQAYIQTYNIDLFDLGFAKDISGLSAAMVAAAMYTRDPDSIYSIFREIDPKGYFKSRLIGRVSYNLYRDARYLVHEAKSIDSTHTETLPQLARSQRKEYSERYYQQLAKAYQLLDRKLERYPFHAAEIHLINLCALLFADFDFEGALEFVINFGRDNDTTAAVTGAILGAYYGAEQLPPEMVAAVLSSNKELGIDLAQVAQQLSEAIWASRPAASS